MYVNRLINIQHTCLSNVDFISVVDQSEARAYCMRGSESGEYPARCRRDANAECCAFYACSDMRRAAGCGCRRRCLTPLTVLRPTHLRGQRDALSNGCSEKRPVVTYVTRRSAGHFRGTFPLQTFSAPDGHYLMFEGRNIQM